MDLGSGPVDIITAGSTYLPNGPLSSLTYGDGATHTASYDNSYRLTGMVDDLSGTKLRDVTYGWSTRDNLISVTDALSTADNGSYDYTAREFLQDANGAWGEFDYSYDSVGNRVSQTKKSNDPFATAITDTYSYPATSNRLQSVAGGQARSFTYDAAGNVTYDARSGTGYGYSYNVQNRMSEFTLNGVVQAEYDYNALGQQVIRRLTQGAQVVHAVHDVAGNRLADYTYDTLTGSVTLIREYVWFNEQMAAVIEGGSIYYVRSDHIGRPVFATDATGTKVWEASYLPFGGVDTSSGTTADLRFPGQWFQSESSTHQNWMRDYDPTTGRYLQADPLGLVDGASAYGYARQNPGRYTDFRGEQSSTGRTSQRGGGSSHQSLNNAVARHLTRKIQAQHSRLGLPSFSSIIPRSGPTSRTVRNMQIYLRRLENLPASIGDGAICQRGDNLVYGARGPNGEWHNCHGTANRKRLGTLFVMSGNLTGAEKVRLAFVNAEVLFASACPAKPSRSFSPHSKESQKSRESQVAATVPGLSAEQKDAFEERTAIMEYDGGLSREIAEYLARRRVVLGC